MRSCGFGWSGPGLPFSCIEVEIGRAWGLAGLRRISAGPFHFSLTAFCRIRSFGAGGTSTPGRGASAAVGFVPGRDAAAVRLVALGRDAAVGFVPERGISRVRFTPGRGCSPAGRSLPGRDAGGLSRIISGRCSRKEADGGWLSSGGRVRIPSAVLSFGRFPVGDGGVSASAGGVSPGGCSVRFFCCFRLWREMDLETASAVCSRRLSAVV